MQRKYIKISGLIIVLALLIAGCNKKTRQVNNNIKPSVKDTATSTTLNNKQEASTGNSVDISDWLTYRNKEYGYSLKYPKNWDITEQNYISKLSQERVKNIIISDPAKNYFLTFGLRKKGEKITLSDNSGFGAIDNIDNNEKIIVAGKTIEIRKLIYKGKVKEILYSKNNSKIFPQDNFEIGNYIIYAKFTANKNYIKKIDLKNVLETKIANNIIKSLTI